MNVRKRGLALLMCICMIFTLLPFSVFAEETAKDVVYGTYDDNGLWTSDSAVSATKTYDTDKASGAKIVYSKTAEPTDNDNEYKVTLTVENTTTKVSPGASAVVLVIDNSLSMNFCATCNYDPYSGYKGAWHSKDCATGKSGEVNAEDSRLYAAKTAAIKFAEEYGATGTGRYIAVVTFNKSASMVQLGDAYWLDVSDDENLATVKEAINGIGTGSGTNLADGLSAAKNDFTDSTVSSISSRYTVLLTDGEPNYPEWNAAGAAKTNATNLKGTNSSYCKLYTVCVGAESKSFNDTTVGVFLKDSIASTSSDTETYAYNTNTTAELYNAFNEIFKSIDKGLNSGLTVTDPMGDHTVLQSTLPTDTCTVADNGTITWTPTSGTVVKNTDGSTTTTYTISYTVKIDVDSIPADRTYPLNGDTTLSFKEDGKTEDTVLHFNVPGAYAEMPRYTVTYNKGANGNLDGQDENNGNVVHNKVKKGTATPAAPKANPNDGYNFTGWSPTPESTVTHDIKYIAQYAKRSDLSYTVNYYWNGTTEKVADSQTVDNQTFGTSVTANPIEVNGYTAVSNDEQTITIGTGENVINFYYYKNVELTANSATVTYDGTEHSVSGFTGAPDGADFSAIKVGAKGTNVGTYDAMFAEGTVGKVDKTAKYIVKAAIDGKLVINPIDTVTVTITGNKSEVTYNGAEQSVSGYTVSIDNVLYKESDFSFNGSDSIKKTDVGEYAMGLSSDQFTNNNKNFSNVVFVVTDGSLTIKQKPVTFTGETDSLIYNGKDQQLKGIDQKGLVSGHTYSGLTYLASGKNVGTYDGAFSGTVVITDAQGTDVTKNYAVTLTPGTLSITKASIAVTFTGESKTVTYNGETQSIKGITAKGLLDGHTYSGLTYLASGKDAGTYDGAFTGDVKIYDGDVDVTENYVVTENPGKLTISQYDKEVVVTITGHNDTRAYNGTAQTVTGYDVTSISSQLYTASDFNFTGNATASGITVGTYNMYMKPEQFSNTSKNFSNVTFNVTDGWLNITPIGSLVITANSETKTYDGTPLTNSGYTFTQDVLKEGDTLTAVVEGTITDAGTAVNKVVSYTITRDNGDGTTTDVTASYNEASFVNGKLTVSQKPVTVTAEDKSKVYGAADPALTAKVEGTLGDDTVEYELSRAAGEDVGSYVITASGEASQGNYAVTYKPATLTISKAETALVVTADSASKVYDGKALTKNSYTLTSGALVDGDELAVVVEGSQTDAGESANVVKSVKVMRGDTDVTANYTIGESVNGTLTITKRAVTLTSGTDEKIYDGKALTNKDVTVSGDGFVKGEGASYDVTGSQTVVGSSENKFSYTLSENTKVANYDIKTVNGTLKVTPVTEEVVVKIVGNTGSFVYDGTEKTVSRYEIVSISSDLYAPEYIEFNGKAEAKGTDVGTYPMNLKSEQFTNTNTETFTNVKFVVEDGSLTITQMPITITAESATGAYILGPITSDKWTNTDTAKGDTVVSVKITGKQETLGESANVPSDAVIKNADGKDVTANYKIDYVNGVLKGIELLEKEEHFNYVIGYPDSSVRPNANISRAEVATIFFRLLTTEARDLYSKTTCDFTDIKDGQWYTRAIATLANAGIVDGYPDGTFNPNAPITRAEMATIIARFAKLDVNTKTFNDINGHWAQKYIELAAGNNWINGYEDGSFRPNKNITRAETFAMINRVLEREVENVVDLLNPSEMNMWTDNLNTDEWYYIDVQEATNYHKCDRIDKSQYEKWTAKIDDIDWASYQI